MTSPPIPSALGVLDQMIAETALIAQKCAEAAPYKFDAIGAGTGVGIRLAALKDARAEIVSEYLREHERARDAERAELR